MIQIILIIIVVMILATVGALWILSPGASQPIVDEAGEPLARSISEKTFVDIGGVKQGMFIKSHDTALPVLLYLHGGMPEYFLTKKYPTGLEKIFTIVWWEQRGSGISYNADIAAETISVQQMINDVVELTQYLQQRFDKEKIYLMGHSGGTFAGIQAAAQKPELYHAYIGIAQMADQLRSEQLAHAYMVKQFSESGNMQLANKLAAAPIGSYIPDAYLKLRDQAMHRLGIGTTRDMSSVVSGILLPSLLCRDYTLIEKVNMWRGKSRSGVALLWDAMLTTNLMLTVPSVDIPVYFCSGIYDYTVSYELSRAYLAHIKAPVKGFYTFSNSAHSPLFEEPEKMQQIIITDVLQGKTSLADKCISRVD